MPKFVTNLSEELENIKADVDFELSQEVNVEALHEGYQAHIANLTAKFERLMETYPGATKVQSAVDIGYNSAWTAAMKSVQNEQE